MKSKCNTMPFTSKRCILMLLLCMAAIKMQAQVSVEMSDHLMTEVTESITFELSGDWSNYGNLIPGDSKLILYGPYNQMLRQEEGSFHDININKTNGDVILSGDVYFQNGMLTVIQQDLVLNGFIIILDPASSLSETNGNTVKGSQGYLTTTRTIIAPTGENIAGLGLTLTSYGNYGDSEIRRGHAAQMANAHEGILRYFDFLPEFNPGMEAAIVFFYDESELNGNTEADLKLFQSPDGGVNWIQVMGVLDISNNSFEAVGINPVSRFTMSSHCLETCIATHAETQPADLYLNAAGLAYLLPENVDDGSTGACGIDTLQVSPDVFDCSGIGIQEVVFTVKDNNGCTKSAMAMVNVLDAIPPDAQCRDVVVYLDENCQATLMAADIDNGSSDACGVDVSVNITSFNCDDIGENLVIMTATDLSGNTSQCTAIVTVLPETVCQDIAMEMGEFGFVVVDPLDMIAGDPEDFEGFTFTAEPDTLYCDQLGNNIVTLTAIDPVGAVTVCQATLLVTGPDADCDNVSDPCDLCDGGDDQQDSDDDGLPDCADWDGWENLVEEWQCASNKVFVCHSGTVICVNQSAVQSHLDHGDFLGACNASFCDEFNPISVGDDLHGIDTEEATLFPGLMHSDVGEDKPGMIQVENYPNPFYPETLIRFHMPSKDWITLSVFNMLGERVIQLAEGMYDSGWHEVKFDGSTSTEGIYIYRIQTHRQSITRSMVLLSK